MHIIEAVFKEFDKNSIAYVHFKSNVDLELSFFGNADFDVLIDKRRLNDAQEIFLKAGGKKFNTIPEKCYSGVDNWLIFDPMDGKIYHIHLHCQLATGKPLLKDYVIPWAELLLATRQYDESWHIYRSDPNLEIILLTVRSVVKARTSKEVKARIGIFEPNKALEREHELLLQIVNHEEVRKYCSELFPKKFSEEISEIVLKSDWSSSDYVALDRIVRVTFKEDRRFSPMEAWLLSKRNRFNLKCRTKLRKTFGATGILKKTSDKSGRIIAFVGVDGAGKSTVTKDIYEWLSPQIDCNRFYMGAGDGKVNLFTRLLKRISKKKAGGNQAGQSSKNDAGQADDLKAASTRISPVVYLKKCIGMYSVYCIEKDNSRKIRMMAKYRLNGGTCILDRYPQTDVEGSNDGPKLCLYEDVMGRSLLYRLLLKREKKVFSITKQVVPDIVFRIHISAETSMKRKPEQTDIEVYRHKIEVLDSIRFGGANIIEIDGEQPYEDELLTIKKAIWDSF